MTPTETLCEIVAALMWGPKVASQLVEVTDSSQPVVHRYLAALHEAGVIRAAGEDDRAGKGRRERIWEMQPTPHKLADWNPRTQARARTLSEAE
jgi:Bacterial regulatory protein, arsR family